ncbi:MAG: 30S ribosomal protein S3 [Candidatus Omnitrophota bacterium]|nr:30S ribosomal protein S3 [Candidatus Omnitrophota bacterium]
MGQKVHPTGLRLGYIKEWSSSWFAKSRDFGGLVYKDVKLRRFIKERFSFAGIAKVEIERAGHNVKLNIYSAKPGVIIGRRGQEIERLKEDLQKFTGQEIYINIKEVKSPRLNAQLVAENVAFQLKKRINFRRAMKKAIAATVEAGGLGIKIACAGRLEGSEIARSEGYKEGKIPLHTFRADIDYGFCEAQTTYGLIGVKVWVYKGEILDPGPKNRFKKGKSDNGTNAQKG